LQGCPGNDQLNLPDVSKLYVSDLDGTLLRNDGLLSDFTRRALNILLEKGLRFTVASARTWSEIKPLMDGVHLKLPVIAVNGAFLSDFHSGRPQIINCLPQEITESIFSHILKTGLMPFICFYDGKEEVLAFEDLINEQMRWFHSLLTSQKQKRLRLVQDLKSVLRHKVVSFAVMGPPQIVSDLNDSLIAEYPGRLENFHFENPYSPGHWWLTVHDSTACKSKALRELADIEGFKMEDVVVFGDHINDIRMFAAAGKAVAVSNAQEKLKAHADEIIGSNEEDAVANYLLKQFE
jgi:hypothetical protein